MQGQVSAAGTVASVEVVIPENGVIGNMVSTRWKNAIQSRMNKQRFDSI